MSSHFAGTHDASSSPNNNFSSASAEQKNNNPHTTTANSTKSPSSFLHRARRVLAELLSFYPSDPTNPQHRRLMNQAKARALIVGCCFVYAGYQHPEYSVISAWYHGSSKPLAEQRWEKMSGGDSPGSRTQQTQVEGIMSGSTKSIYQQKKEFREEAEAKKSRWF
jgi:hypothetical protein